MKRFWVEVIKETALCVLKCLEKGVQLEEEHEKKRCARREIDVKDSKTKSYDFIVSVGNRTVEPFKGCGAMALGVTREELKVLLEKGKIALYRGNAQ